VSIVNIYLQRAPDHRTSSTLFPFEQISAFTLRTLKNIEKRMIHFLDRPLHLLIIIVKIHLHLLIQLLLKIHYHHLILYHTIIKFLVQILFIMTNQNFLMSIFIVSMNVLLKLIFKFNHLMFTLKIITSMFY
jgi:hypothetical protein